MLPKDKPTISVKNDLIEINHGRRFPIIKWYPIYLVLFVLIVALFFPSKNTSLSTGLILGLIIFLIAMFTNYSGLIVKIKEGKFNFFTGVFYLKIGKWKKFSGYSCLVLKTTNKSKEGLSFLESEEIYDNFHKFKSTELYLMNSTHRKKIFCGSFDTYQEAKDFAKEVSEIMKYPIEKFNPKRIDRKRR